MCFICLISAITWRYLASGNVRLVLVINGLYSYVVRFSYLLFAIFVTHASTLKGLAHPSTKTGQELHGRRLSRISQKLLHMERESLLIFCSYWLMITVGMTSVTMDLTSRRRTWTLWLKPDWNWRTITSSLSVPPPGASWWPAGIRSEALNVHICY